MCEDRKIIITLSAEEHQDLKIHFIYFLHFIIYPTIIVSQVILTYSSYKSAVQSASKRSELTCQSRLTTIGTRQKLLR